MSGLNISTLRKSAQSTTVQRSHKMRWDFPEPQTINGEPFGGFRQAGECKDCGRTVHLVTHPAPNEIDICGEAVALDCSDPHC